MAWIRHRDIHILTVGSYTYTTDQRFQATYNKDLGESTLEIKWASIRDAGLYECNSIFIEKNQYSFQCIPFIEFSGQISSQPVRSLFVHLDVVGNYNVQSNLILSKF